MGESHVSLANDASAIYYNPAGLARLSSKELSASHHSYLAGIQYNSLLYAQPTKLGTFGTAFNYLSVSGIERRDKNEQFQGSAVANDLAVSFSFARTLLSSPATVPKGEGKARLSGGFNLKIIRQQLDVFQAQAIAIDFGILTPLRNSRFQLGAALQNLGTALRFVDESYALPQTIRAGLSYQAKKVPLTVAGSVSFPRDHAPSLQLGGEYWLISPFALRAGYMLRPKNDLSIFRGLGSKTENSFNQLTGLVAGAGIKFANFNLDYAFVPLGDLGSTHQVSLGIKFK